MSERLNFISELELNSPARNWENVLENLLKEWFYTLEEEFIRLNF